MIEARGLTKTFRDRARGEVRAVEGVSFSCAAGQIYGLLGANGAGKTTALRLLATLLAPSAGTATVAGADLVREPTRVRASIGFLTTATALYGRLTAREMVEYFGRLQGWEGERLRQRVDALFTRLDLHGFSHRRCDRCSTGIKQRISIARALVHDPQVIILDEPTLGLDVFSARTIVDFMRECRERGRTVLYSTHIMTEAEKLCDRIGLLHGGRLLAEGTLEELRATHAERDLEELFMKVVGASRVTTKRSDR